MAERERNRQPGYISPDNGQGMQATDTCRKFGCDDADLERDRRGFWVCPCCSASYGREAKGGSHG